LVRDAAPLAGAENETTWRHKNVAKLHCIRSEEDLPSLEKALVNLASSLWSKQQRGA
jgi:hypothetical protein